MRRATFASRRRPGRALHGLVSYGENGLVHHRGPFGVAVDHGDGWSAPRVRARLSEAEAVHIVATGVPRAADYGPVLVIGGKHRGKIGYYDDDDDRDASVYFGVPFMELWESVPLHFLVSVDVTFIGLERLRRDAPLVYDLIVGLPVGAPEPAGDPHGEANLHRLDERASPRLASRPPHSTTTARFFERCHARS